MALADGGGADFGQVNFFVGERFVLTLQEREFDWREPVRDRIRKGRTFIRRRGADYLGYALLDSMVDYYFPVIEQYSVRLEAMEEEVLSKPTQDDIARIHALRNPILASRHHLAPLKSVVNTLSKEELPPITEETRIYFRDLSDHITHLLENIDMDREAARSLIDLSLSISSTRMNEVMKVLTIIATIFMPLGFIAGVFGMNFDPEKSPFNMPELGWYFGYPYALLLMAGTVVWMLFLFRRKGWLGSGKK
jgi:magnesium transporter